MTSDAGVYQCIASNSVASVQAAAQLQVRAKGNKIVTSDEVTKFQYHPALR